MDEACAEFICCFFSISSSDSFFLFPVVCFSHTHPFQTIHMLCCMGLLSLTTCKTDKKTVRHMPRQSLACAVFLTYKPSPFSSFTGKITARLFWNVWTGTAYFTLLLIFDRCSAEAHIHINWSHMRSPHMTVHHTTPVCCAAVQCIHNWRHRHFEQIHKHTRTWQLPTVLYNKVRH